MRWRRDRQGDSESVEDGRADPGAGGSSVRRPGLGIGGLGAIGIGVAAIFLLRSCLGGGGLGDVLGKIEQPPNLPEAPSAPSGSGADGLPQGAPSPDDERVRFVEFVADNVQTTWSKIFSDAGQRYFPTTVRLYRQAVRSACGVADSSAGPFYCPADQRIYLDLSFFDSLSRRFGAPGDFAQAYVIAHEFGHHVQNQIGVAQRVAEVQRQNPGDANELSVRLELQADCFAGVWAHSTYQQGILEEGDLEEGLRAAAAVGDDNIQAQTTGRINPEGFTHGTSEQRVEWFQRGFRNGAVRDCDTFEGTGL